VILFREYPDILTVAQVAQALGIGKKAVYALVNKKSLGALRVGRTIKIPKFALEEYVKTARNNVVL
jgi:excisionase family DNA binding protein